MILRVTIKIKHWYWWGTPYLRLCILYEMHIYIYICHICSMHTYINSYIYMYIAFAYLHIHMISYVYILVHACTSTHYHSAQANCASIPLKGGKVANVAPKGQSSCNYSIVQVLETRRGLCIYKYTYIYIWATYIVIYIKHLTFNLRIHPIANEQISMRKYVMKSSWQRGVERPQALEVPSSSSCFRPCTTP